MPAVLLGRLRDRDGLGQTTYVDERYRLRTRSWAIPPAQLHAYQHATVPVLEEHDGQILGFVEHLELDPDEQLFMVAELDVDVDRPIEVFVSSEFERGHTMLRSVALVERTAHVGAVALRLLPRPLKHASGSGWCTYAERHLLTRAVAAVEARRRGGPLLIERRAPRPADRPPAARHAGHGYDRPPGQLWHRPAGPNSILSVR